MAFLATKAFHLGDREPGHAHFGKRFAYSAEDSQSGYHAPRRLLAPYARARGLPLFASTVGPLITPRRVVEAIIAGDADAGPLDSYALDLMRLNEPALTTRLRTVGSTLPTPIPPLVEPRPRRQGHTTGDDQQGRHTGDDDGPVLADGKQDARDTHDDEADQQ